MDKQAVFIPRKWVTKGLPTGGDYGFIPGPDAWESYLERWFLDASNEDMPLCSCFK
ncbi:MAG: hypothetical protein VYC62_09850 [Verrucomicrobiota bacterium]|nr:hypothetical protein [Verrucomicrobiota bacterium]